MFRFLLLSLIAVALATPAARHHQRNNHQRKNKIVGGTSATINQFKYQVVLFPSDGVNTYICGGSILSSRYILSAAHCFEGITRVQVRAGSTYYNSGGQLLNAVSYRIHELYNPNTHDYDIAYVDMGTNLIKINNQTTGIVKLAAAGSDPSSGQYVTVTGWGTTKEGGDVSQNLQQVQIRAIDRATCNKSYGGITTRMICAGVPGGGKDSCQGDSGGPLVDSNTKLQVGIVSFGVGCARADYPGVYSNVGNLRNWIKQNTGI